MIGPDVRDERLMELRGRGLPVQLRVPWRSYGIVLSAVFFVLTSVAAAATYALLDEVDVPAKGIVTAALCIGVAEYLIRRRYFFGTGIESALWVGGLFAVIFDLPGQSRPEALLLFAGAAAVAGMRVRSAFLLAVAAAFVISYAVEREQPQVAVLIAMAIAVTALLELRYEWQRPRTEQAWMALLIFPPIVAAIATAATLRPLWGVAYALLAAGCFAVGIAERIRAPLLAAAVNAIVVFSTLAAHDLLPLRVEWRLILGGAALLATSVVVSRMLARRTRGIVVTPEKLTPIDEELQIIGTVALQPEVEKSSPERDGGRFGGAGATGDY